MLKKIIRKLFTKERSLDNNPLLSEYLNYLKSSYPHNHNYKVKKNQLVPARELAHRYKKVRALLPQPLTSLADIGSSKGFFVFAASEHPECTHSLGIDVYPYDIKLCQWLKEYLQYDRVQFEYLRLHELAESVEKFGGPFQTILILNLYQYLYFGSERCPARYLNHDEIFKNMRKICSQRVIFNNRVRLEDCQNVEHVERASEKSLEYTEEKIIAAASKYFKVTPCGKVGKYPLWTMDVKE